jgi:hypothetical protein
MERADKAKKLMACALKGLELAIAQCKPGARFRDLGRAEQVDPIRPTLKAPGSKRLKLENEQLHWNFAFKFNFRRYI